MDKKRLNVLNPNAAGIDVGSEAHYVAVPSDRSDTPVRSFGSFTKDIHALAHWLKSCGIETVAMESTGIYWVQLYLILEEYGFEVFLVNAQHVKNVSGRKSDVSDCQWIQQLHSYGLLQASFQPESIIRELRTYLRHRRNLTASSSRQVLLMQKAFEQMNIKLHNVLSDICGKSGMLIIQDILRGERDAEKLASHADKQVKASREEIVDSLTGIWREEHLFELGQAYDLYLVFREKVRLCDIQIEKTLKKIEEESSTEEKVDKKRQVYSKNRLNFNATKYLYNILGIDITAVYGISELVAVEIISEIGTDMSKWKTEKHFTSWLNLSPNKSKSGGRIVKSKQKKKHNKAGQVFLMAAFAVQRSDNWLGHFYRKVKSRKGPLVATKATARKIAVIFYEMLKYKKEFNPIPVELYNEKYKEYKIKQLGKQAAVMGYELTPCIFVS